MKELPVRYCYVAEDPKQPGAAYAAVVDDPKYPKDTAKDVADFIRRGAIVSRVPTETALEMLGRWKRPQVDLPSPPKERP